MTDRDFSFDNGTTPHENPEAGERGIFDTLIDGAGGKALPGRWGLAQALFALWAPDLEKYPAVKHTKNGLMSAGLIRAYRKNKKRASRRKRKNPIVVWLRANNFAKVTAVSTLSEMIFVYSSELEHEDFIPPPPPGLDASIFGKDFIRVFTLPSGKRFCYWMYTSDAATYGPKEHIVNGPYTTDNREDQEAFLDDINEVIWGANGGKDLQLSTIKSTRSTRYRETDSWGFRLESIGEPGDYISGDTVWTDLDRLSHRVITLRESGVSRNILFHGPPGTGKTSLARNLARKIGSGRSLRVEIRAIKNAGISGIASFIQLLKPRVLLVDDIDRELGAVIEFLHMFEQTGNSSSSVFLDGLVTVATINSIKEIDPALLRPGRFDEVVYVKEPKERQRAGIIEHYVKKHNLKLPAEDSMAGLIKDMAGFAGADIKEVIQCTAALGWGFVQDEITRVSAQRAHYDEAAFDRYKGRVSTGLESEASRVLRDMNVSDDAIADIMVDTGKSRNEVLRMIVQKYREASAGAKPGDMICLSPVRGDKSEPTMD